MGRLILVGLLAFAVALTGTPAFAEVQNIKVSGDIDMKAIIQENYDLRETQLNIAGGGAQAGAGGAAVTSDDDAALFLTTTRVRVDADLTDNVSASVRLLNQRFWDTDIDATNNVDIDNAYVVLKEFLYSPLTVIVGRQDLNYGTGFIVGPGLLGNPNGNFSAAINTGAQGQIGQQYSAYNAYDAIRVILDFAPITVEGLVAKISEGGVGSDDQDLYGALLNYKFDQWSAEIEPYWFFKNDETAAVTPGDSGIAGGVGRVYENNRVHTFGARAAGAPIENLWVNLEGAAQFGEIEDDTIQQDRDREGWAANVDVRYTWANAPWTPVTGVGWVFFSGNDSASGTGDQSGDFEAWDPMYRGNFFTYIQEFLGGFDATNLYATFDANDTAANTNRHLFYGDIGLKVMEDLNFWARFTHARFDEEPVAGRDSEAGNEIDAKLTYDYTEDVQLGVFGGIFLPGSYYDEATSNARGNEEAWTLGGSAVVKF